MKSLSSSSIFIFPTFWVQLLGVGRTARSHICWLSSMFWKTLISRSWIDLFSLSGTTDEVLFAFSKWNHGYSKTRVKEWNLLCVLGELPLSLDLLATFLVGLSPIIFISSFFTTLGNFFACLRNFFAIDFELNRCLFLKVIWFTNDFVCLSISFFFCLLFWVISFGFLGRFKWLRLDLCLLSALTNHSLFLNHLSLTFWRSESLSLLVLNI